MDRHALFSPDRSPSSAAQQFLSQFSTWKPAAGAGSDLEMLNVFLEAARKLNTSGVLDDVLNALLEAALRLTRLNAASSSSATPMANSGLPPVATRPYFEHYGRQHYLALDPPRCR